MLTTINELFVFVPKGMGQTFIKRYATDDAYKKKISFVEDTGEIYTNGKSFGGNCKAAIAELTGKVEEVKVLADKLKNFDPAAITEVQTWIANHGTEFTTLSEKVTENKTSIDTIKTQIENHGTEFTTLSEKVTANKSSIDQLTSDVETIQKNLDELDKISVWQEFVADTDMPPVTDTTKVIETKESLDTLENTENEDIVVTSNDAMKYFLNKNSKTFKNITL